MIPAARGMSCSFWPMPPEPGRLPGRPCYGNALLSRVTLRAVQRVDISVPGREPRGAVQVKLALPSGSVSLVATHLGLAVEERRRQADRIAGMLERTAADAVILMGDFNEWRPWGRSLRRLQGLFDALAAPATFPSRYPVLALDRIWVRPAQALRAMQVFTDAPARNASDHLPVVADLEL
jgi:endonuclease/exonuclease/phosphatase family metal-dependent hydrolase